MYLIFFWIMSLRTISSSKYVHVHFKCVWAYPWVYITHTSQFFGAHHLLGSYYFTILCYISSFYFALPVIMLNTAAAAAAKSLQSCPTLCNPIDGSPPGTPVPGILQARTLEWVAISSSNAWKWKVKVKSLSRVQLLATPWTAAYQAPPSMEFSRQEYWSGLPLPSPTEPLGKTNYISYSFISFSFIYCY